ncbi:ejaculatory bulb-specific protein 3-like [Periplaneta americana]|uniref:ejaculatory bulb-specific protein 3-like n=1 Tax=Periplaneta americana TaxID=6978 RepID=UPI0037E9C5C0
MAGCVATVCFVLLAATPLCRSGLPQEEKYTTRWDNIDVDEILQSDRLLRNYVKCMLDNGPCTPDAAELKKTLPDALETDCSKCSEKQKTASTKVIHYLIDNKKEDWAKLEAKYDPEGSYRIKYEAELRKDDVSIAPAAE